MMSSPDDRIADSVESDMEVRYLIKTTRYEMVSAW